MKNEALRLNTEAPLVLKVGAMTDFLWPCFVREMKPRVHFLADRFDIKVLSRFGKELFEFNRDGTLTRTITQYNDTDQDITYYKYDNGELVEKRMESYKGKVLDESTSMANFYEIDTVPNRKVIEKIISYDKQFLEQQQYHYDDEGKLMV